MRRRTSFSLVALLAAGAVPLGAGTASAAVAVNYDAGSKVLTFGDSPFAPTSNKLKVVCTSSAAAVQYELNDAAPVTTAATCGTVTRITAAMGTGTDRVDTSTLSPALNPALAQTPLSVDVDMGEDGRGDTGASETFTGGGLGERVDDSGGADMVSTAAGNDLVVTGFGADQLDFGLGTGDRMELGVVESPTLTDSSVSFNRREASCTGICIRQPVDKSLSGLELVTLDSAGAETAQRIDAARFSGTATILGSELNDTVLPAAKGNVDGRGGTDRLTFTGSGAQVLTDAGVTGFQPRTLTSVEQATWTGSGAADTFDASAWTGSLRADAGAGNDVLTGGAGPGQVLLGGGDDDRVTLAGGTGSADGGPGQDVLRSTGTTGARTFSGGPGADDVVAAGTTSDVDGGDGDDTLALGPGQDDVAGGAGTDTVTGDVAGELDVTPTQVGPDVVAAEVLRLRGSAGRDVVRAPAYAGRLELTLLEGDDEVAGGTGPLVVDAGAGDDTVAAPASPAVTCDGGPGNDACTTGPAADAVTGAERFNTGEGDDSVTTDGPSAGATGPGADRLRGGAGVDEVDLGPGNDVAETGGGDDRPAGGEGDDVLDGGDGDETFVAEPGADRITGGGGSDTADYAARTGPQVVDLSGAATSGAPGEGDLLAGLETGLGGTGPDRLTAGDGAQALRGLGGNDVLDGGAGPDLLAGGPGADYLLAGPGGPGDGDVLTGGDGTDVVSYARRTGGGVKADVDGQADDGSPGEGDQVAKDVEILVGSPGDDELTADQEATPAVGPGLPKGKGRINVKGLVGLGGKDRLTGGPDGEFVGGGTGDDVVDGGAGNDSVHGGSGDDDLEGDAGNDRLQPEKGKDEVEGGAGDDVTFSQDLAQDEVDCGTGSDQVYQGASDELAPACEDGDGRQDAKKPAAPGGQEDGTDQTLEEGDGAFGGGGDAGPDANGNGLNAWTSPEEYASDFAIGDSGFSEAFSDEFGTGFDETAFGTEGFDDFGDAFGEDLQGKEPPAATLRTRTASVATRTAPLQVACPKSLEQRCIGELVATAPGKAKELGSALFTVRNGKRVSAKLKLNAAGRKALAKAKGKGLKLAVTLNGRDRGTGLFQSTSAVTVRKTAKGRSRR